MLITHNQHYELVEKGERLLSTYAHQLQSARMCSSREHIMLKCFEVAVPALKCQSAAAVENAHPQKLSPQMCPSSDFCSFRKKKKKGKLWAIPAVSLQFAMLGCDDCQRSDFWFLPPRCCGNNLFGWMWTDRFPVMSFSADPLLFTHIHTHTFRSEGAQIPTLFLPRCYTNRLAEAWGLFTIGVCVHTLIDTDAHTHPGTHVRQPPCRTLGMRKSLEEAGTYVLLCPLNVSCITKRPTVESLCKCIQYLCSFSYS